MTYNRKQLEAQLDKAMEEVKKLYEMAQETKIEVDKDDEDEALEVLYMAHDIAAVTYTMYVNYENLEVEHYAEALEAEWVR